MKEKKRVLSSVGGGWNHKKDTSFFLFLKRIKKLAGQHVIIININ